MDADKQGPSLKNALIGSFFLNKWMLDNALLRGPDRGPAHSKDTLRPYLVKGVGKSCVPLAILAHVSHISRPERIRALDWAFRNLSA